MKPLISVIIPVYNVEAYLKRAVESVLGQTYRNLDIILVDDGSTDGCPAICDDYAQRQARIRVIHKENGGLSDARNAGLKIAGGDYIAFLDSDDYLAPQFIEILYEELCRADAQIAVCSFEKTEALKREDGPDFAAVYEKYKKGEIPVSVLDRRQMLLNQYETRCADATDFIVAWNKLYKASLFKKLRYPKGRIHEDEATTYKLFDRIERGVYVKLPLYAYFFMEDSITRKKFTKKRLDWIEALDERVAFFLEKQEYELAREALRARADGAIRYYAYLKEGEKHISKEKKRIRALVRETLRKNHEGVGEDGAFLSARTRLGYHIFLLCPSLHRRLVHY